MIDSTTSPRLTTGILGSGQIGAASAVLAARAGHQVLLWTRSAHKQAAISAELSKLSAFCEEHMGEPKQPLGAIQIVTDLSLVEAESDVLLECIIEDMDEKVALLSHLTACVNQDKLVLSATSGLSITDMARRSGLEKVLVGAHFWNPPYLIPIVEVIAGEATPPQKVEQACAWLDALGKRPIRCPDIPGFIGNRLMHALWREALALVDAGACSPADIDAIVKYTFALRLPALGPMENMDLVGLDLVNRVQTYLLPDLATNAIPADSLRNRLAAGQTGMTAGQGFYDWRVRDATEVVRQRDLTILHLLRMLGELPEKTT
ncbi:3-hydroxyacyl-CoA dehydrogenase family protein [Spirosoma linguale]|uniref:3-hydroxyacyl-CoA dehydrogenase NAD-binding protein n=1 Tax=Spirosoma linguale (strain ATCC 33905 / DSM 74 / LMG 10896 / Claus 1) TaxID=504472 RepID=D2QBG1_SPILD|nr:3-hydroxyacyl-CoA dehydrogenase NAD-binding protein [Spirosoma linguale DSM 74]